MAFYPQSVSKIRCTAAELWASQVFDIDNFAKLVKMDNVANLGNIQNIGNIENIDNPNEKVALRHWQGEDPSAHNEEDGDGYEMYRLYMYI